MYLEGYPITFNKLDKNKRKRKYIDDIRYNIGYNFEQMTIPHLNKNSTGKQLLCYSKYTVNFWLHINEIR